MPQLTAAAETGILLDNADTIDPAVAEMVITGKTVENTLVDIPYTTYTG